jgi:multidrug efflux pump subunit AcrA (membrane-fusion protein)
MNIFFVFLMILLLSSCQQSNKEALPVQKDITETIFAAGSLESDSVYTITALSEGYISELFINENDSVQSGAIVAIIQNQKSDIQLRAQAELYQNSVRNTTDQSPALRQAANQLESALRTMQQDSLQAERYAQLVKSGAVSRTDYEKAILAYQNSKLSVMNARESYDLALNNARRQLIYDRSQKEIEQDNSNKINIRALSAGIVYEKLRQRGDYIRPGDIIARIGKKGHFYARVYIDESSLSKIRIGQKAVIQLNADKSKTYEAIVRQIYPAFSQQDQTFSCRLDLAGQPDMNILHAQLQANINVAFHKQALLIPRSFLKNGNSVKIKGKAGEIPVKTRFVSSEWVQILQGISPDDILEL